MNNSYKWSLKTTNNLQQLCWINRPFTTLHDPALHCILYFSNSKWQLNPTHFYFILFYSYTEICYQSKPPQKKMQKNETRVWLPFLVLTSFRASPGVQYLHLLPYPCGIQANSSVTAGWLPKNNRRTALWPSFSSKRLDYPEWLIDQTGNMSVI